MPSLRAPRTHQCGHDAFSDYKLLDDAGGFVRVSVFGARTGALADYPFARAGHAYAALDAVLLVDDLALPASQQWSATMCTYRRRALILACRPRMKHASSSTMRSWEIRRCTHSSCSFASSWWLSRRTCVGHCAFMRADDVDMFVVLNVSGQKTYRALSLARSWRNQADIGVAEATNHFNR